MGGKGIFGILDSLNTIIRLFHKQWRRHFYFGRLLEFFQKMGLLDNEPDSGISSQLGLLY